MTESRPCTHPPRWTHCRWCNRRSWRGWLKDYWWGLWSPVLAALVRGQLRWALGEYLQRTRYGAWTPRTRRLFWWCCDLTDEERRALEVKHDGQ